MLAKYRAFSWTYTPAELEKVLIAQMDEILTRTLNYTEKLIKSNPDPDQLEMLKMFEDLRVLRESLVAGKESDREWSEVVDWSWQTFSNDPSIGGSYGIATYYAKIKRPEEIPAGKTKVMIDREAIHLDLEIDIIT
jgi:hypothetical protein